MLYAKGIARTNAFAANLVCMSEVVLAPCWSALLFGEAFHWNEFFGAAIIVLVIVATWHPMPLAMAFWWRLSAIETKSVPDGIRLPFTVKNTPLSEWY